MSTYVSIMYCIYRKYIKHGQRVMLFYNIRELESELDYGLEPMICYFLAYRIFGFIYFGLLLKELEIFL